MSEQKYSRIYFLVHPLYFPFVGDLEEFKLNYVCSKLLGVYGKKILEAMSDPSVFLIIVKPAYAQQLNGDSRVLKQIKLFETRFLEPLLEFAKRKLGSRLYVTNYDFRYLKNTTPLLPKDLFVRFKNKVRVNAFGEYADYCVESWSNELVKLLERNQITAHLQIEHTASLPFSRSNNIPKNNVTLWDRLSQAEARKKRKRLIGQKVYTPRFV